MIYISPIYFELIGWIGTIFIMTAYFLVSAGKIKSDSKTYQLFNMFGAGFVIVNVAYHGALPSIVLNAIWFLIAMYGLFRKPS